VKRSGPLSRGLGERLTNPFHKNSACYEMFTQGLGEMLWNEPSIWKWHWYLERGMWRVPVGLPHWRQLQEN